MDLELATTYDIADELANRGMQFIIAIQTKDNLGTLNFHLCTDSKKDQGEVAEALIPFFVSGEQPCLDSEPE